MTAQSVAWTAETAPGINALVYLVDNRVMPSLPPQAVGWVTRRGRLRGSDAWAIEVTFRRHTDQPRRVVFTAGQAARWLEVSEQAQAA